MSVDSYDYENRLTKVTAPDATLSFNYCSCPTLTGIDGYGSSGCSACADSPSGKRISKTVDGTTIYTICFDPTMDFDQNGNIIARYVQNPTMLDEPISIESAQGKFYYLFDGLGSVTGLTDSGGSLVSTYSYDAFGNILSETGDATLNAINPDRVTSRVDDKESGLYYYRARYYDSKTGRFTQKDPLRSELREGKNLYVYCGNNPVNGKDPLGLATHSPLKYKVCFWGWCKTVTYGWQVTFNLAETNTIAASFTAGAITAGVLAVILVECPPAAAVAGTLALILGLYGGVASICASWGRGLVVKYIFFTPYITPWCS